MIIIESECSRTADGRSQRNHVVEEMGQVARPPVAQTNDLQASQLEYRRTRGKETRLAALQSSPSGMKRLHRFGYLLPRAS